MTPPDENVQFPEALAALEKLLDQYPGVIIGGIASSVLGNIRLTADVDAMIFASTENIPAIIQTAAELGITPRIEKAVEFARKNRVLLLRQGDSATNIDISLGLLPFEKEVIARRQKVAVGSITIPLPTPEDLIIMKAVANRPKDMLDIQGILQAHPSLDRKRIEFWLKQFAEALDRPEIWLEVEKILAG